MLWTGGEVIDLNSYLEDETGWALQSAVDINDEGQIVGDGGWRGNATTFFLEPVNPVVFVHGAGASRLSEYDPFTGEEELIRLPRAFQVDAVFTALPEAIVDSWYRRDPEAVREWFATFRELSSPNLLPPLVEETLEQLANRDFFFDRPIVPMGEERRPAEEQFNEYTSRVAIILGDMFDVSPRRIDHAIEGLFGPVGGDVLGVLGLGPPDQERERELAEARAFWAAQEIRDLDTPSVLGGLPGGELFLPRQADFAGLEREALEPVTEPTLEEGEPGVDPAELAAARRRHPSHPDFVPGPSPVVGDHEVAAAAEDQDRCPGAVGPGDRLHQLVGVGATQVGGGRTTQPERGVVGEQLNQP